MRGLPEGGGTLAGPGAGTGWGQLSRLLPLGAGHRDAVLQHVCGWGQCRGGGVIVPKSCLQNERSFRGQGTVYTGLYLKNQILIFPKAPCLF